MEQMKLDLRLDYERSLQDNLNTVAKFARDKMQQNMAEQGRPLKTVESDQEAYGIAAQQYTRVLVKQKVLKSRMDDFLNTLDVEGEAMQIAGNIYAAAMELAQEAVLMAAQASRIISDLCYLDPKTPLENYLEENEEDVDDGEE